MEPEETTTEAVEVADLVPEAPAEVDDLPADQDTFDRTYVEKLRAESAKYRTRAREATDAFSSFDEKDQAYIRDTFKKASDADPAIQKIAADNIHKMADAIAGVAPAAQEEIVSQDEDKTSTKLTETPETYITKDEFDQWRAQETAKNNQVQQVNMIEKEFADAGFPRGTAEFDLAWGFARGSTEGDLPAAIQMVKDYKQKITDSAIGELSGNQDKFPSQSGTKGEAPGTEANKVRTFPEAKQDLIAFLKAQPGEQS